MSNIQNPHDIPPPPSPGSTQLPPMTGKKESTAQDFKKNVYVLLELPSGNVCRARKPGLQKIMAEGKVPNSLQPMLQDAMSGNKGASDSVVEVVSEMDPETIADAMAFTDNVVVSCVSMPTILPLPSKDEWGREVDKDGELLTRNPDDLYVDELDEVDKSFILTWAFGGSSNVQEFLEKQEAMLVDLRTSQGVGQDPG